MLLWHSGTQRKLSPDWVDVHDNPAKDLKRGALNVTLQFDHHLVFGQFLPLVVKDVLHVSMRIERITPFWHVWREKTFHFITLLAISMQNVLLPIQFFALQIVLYATVTDVPMTQCKRVCPITCYLSENCATQKLQLDSGYSLIYGT